MATGQSAAGVLAPGIGARRASAGLKGVRERRVDALRGLALMCIFVDHISKDWLSGLTLRNFGLSDAAELFVLLAGFASTMAYGRSFERDGPVEGLRRIGARCFRLYVFQVGLLLSTLAIVWVWEANTQVTLNAMAPVVNAGMTGLKQELTLQAQPSNLNILPLYIVLLGLFPLLYAGMRRTAVWTVAGSAAIWAAANLTPGLNLTNQLDGTGWFFDPFAWQLLFVLGMAMAMVMKRRNGELPRFPWLVALCWVVLALSFFEAFPWRQWGLPNLAPVTISPPDKTYLAPLRLLHALAFVYVVLTWSGLKTVIDHRPFSWLEACGRHSLEVFSLGTLLDLFGRLAFKTYGDTLNMQIMVNAIGLGGMLMLAMALERGKGRNSAPQRPARLDPQPLQRNYAPAHASSMPADLMLAKR